MDNLERRVKALENQIFELKCMIAQSQGYSQDVQSSLWDSEKKQKEKNRDLSNSTNNVYNNLFNYEFQNNQNVEDCQEAIGELAELSDTNSSDITDCQEAISELMELIEEGI